MWGLIYKDYYLMRGTALILVVFIVPLLSALSLRQGVVGMMMAISYAFVLGLTFCSTDMEKKNNALNFSLLLPVPAQKTVDAKFLELLLIIALSWFFSLLGVIVSHIIGLVTFTLYDLLVGIMFSAVISMVVFGIDMWLLFCANNKAALIYLFPKFILIGPILDGSWQHVAKSLINQIQMAFLPIQIPVIQAIGFLLLGSAMTYLVLWIMARRSVYRHELN